MKKKKILFVVNYFNIGGVQKSLLSLLYKLDYNSLDVSLVILSGKETLVKHLPKQVSVIHVDPVIKFANLLPKEKGFFKLFLNYLFSSNFKVSLQALLAIISAIISRNMTQKRQKFWINIKKYLPVLEEEFDVAIGVSGGTSMMYVADCVNAKKKISWIRTDYRALNRDLKIDKIYFRQMHTILSVSNMCKDIFLELFPDTSKKLKVMYNVLPFKMYENIKVNKGHMKEENVIKILTISRLDKNKGIDLAIDALEILLNKGFNIKWYILGKGKSEKKIQKLIKNKGLENHFVLLGVEFNTAEFIKKADIIVHPSRLEGKSNVVDEAKYLLKPIVATKYDTVHEQLVNEKTGLISDITSKSIATNIIRILNEKNLTETFQKNLQNEIYNDNKSMKTFYEVI